MGKTLALDQSSHISGYSIFEDGKLITFGKFTVNENNIGERLNKIKQNILSLISDNNITNIIIEDIQMQSNVVNNVQTFKVLAEVIGVIYEMAYELGISIDCVLASSWKSALGIKGKSRPEQKRAAQEYVLTTYDIKATQDECDAICIGTYSAKQNNNLAW